MKRRKKSVTVTIETHKLTIVRPLHEPITVWCEQCGADRPMVTPVRAAVLVGVTPREIYRRVEMRSLHFVETASGALLICCSQERKR